MCHNHYYVAHQLPVTTNIKEKTTTEKEINRQQKKNFIVSTYILRHLLEIKLRT